MCTSITMKTLRNKSFFGRNMDFSHDIDPHFFIVPRQYIWRSAADMRKITTRYKFIGIGQKLEGLLSFFDGVNETGFAAAALYFSGYAKYDSLYQDTQKIQLAAFDFLKYILGRCSTVSDVKQAVKEVSLIGIADPVTKAAAPLHWIAAEKNGRCVVIEKTEKGFTVFENQIGVLTNAPDFSWHMTNLNNYTDVTSIQCENAQWGEVKLSAPSQAGGTIGLPGGFASPERFVRTAFIKEHTYTPPDDNSAVGLCFQCLKSVSIPKGVIMTGRDTSDFTLYTAFINQEKGDYFVNTHTNQQIYKASINDRKSNQWNQKLIDLGSIFRPVEFLPI